MAATAKTQKPVENDQPNDDDKGRPVKSCFTIMPIANMDDYDDGHFSRVYEHLIKPACLQAGYVAHRADVVASSNYIIIDILQKIIESDIVICDLSGRNPNVLYELGVRQAFNLPTVLIKDKKTPRIFDIQGLRTIEYRHTLRIDEVTADIASIQNSIQETAAARNDVNSMLQLLGRSAAPLPQKVELSNDTSVILESLKDISRRITRLESSRSPNPDVSLDEILDAPIKRLGATTFEINKEPVKLGEELFISGKSLGWLESASAANIVIKTKPGLLRKIPISDPDFGKLTTLPF
ncbi:hypothetical protein [Pseudomonas guariconensis]|uniref:hypothetical protein n=1 Tax=Pseudomonas guariconensis TaxID=1288410 RepID=UPI00209B70F8|nr:hypothetical protein [Pseudomonas guariconensis]MCO7624726.1 hypothetical protein [Pseudomonas guariconensis]